MQSCNVLTYEYDVLIVFEPEHSIFYNIACARSKDLNEPAHPQRLISLRYPPDDALDP